MDKELNLQIPDSLYSNLEMKARGQGVSIEALCLLLLEGKDLVKDNLIDPTMYSSLSNGQMRLEMTKVLNSNLSKIETQKRVRQLESQILRCIR